ncbi:biliverdin-producing heme oxygenase [Frondihabitans sucicola]|uniref:Biliverdin-producing heme oxygenase n=1 Tax=Frondihabitans sucicola TaxID=1268041 RepID=A0ABM8GIX2_9MICO|nr:biliverdin-producing heme oxygenase [Frondihabitans sucicola]BDZ48338.1 biliverdin-producing heme oxygenase [Frondihabitans sucicola]
MPAAIPFSQALRERTSVRSAVPSASERFMAALLSGRSVRADYVALVAQNYFVYGALERAAEQRASDPVAATFMSPALTRLPAIREDLRFLIGEDWQDSIAPLATTKRYVDRIESVAATSTGAFVAHHYTRYLGDLSGCAIIRAIMQRQFGFETNGVGFYLFADIAKPKEFKSTYRAQLDAVGWSEEERERVIAEVGVAYRLTEELFEDLSSSRNSTAA